MKKFFLSVLAVAALASCTKMDTAYEAPQEIGFKAVAGNMTKAAVDGENFPTTLNMYVFAETTDNNGATANYINNGQFIFKGNYNTYVNPNPAAASNPNVWGGVTPYYWPNVKKLHFSGYSKSGNVATDATVSYNCSSNSLSISNYSPGTSTNAGENDLMWFPCTSLTNAEGYGKETDYVSVNMYHTCSWITFLVQGDNVTGASNSTYKVTGITINNIDQQANVVCSATASNGTITPNIVWTENTIQTTNNYQVTLKSTTGVSLTTEAQNVENITEANPGNIVLIPQSLAFSKSTADGNTTYTGPYLTVTYTYESPASTTGNPIVIEEVVSGLSLKVSDTEASNKWEPGKHYTYTLTIKANEILIAPKPIDWNEGSHTVTVE